MLFNRHNKNEYKVVNLKKISVEEYNLQNFLSKKIFNWQEKQIQIIVNNSDISTHKNYIGLHTALGIFYIINGVNWLQSITSIYIENKEDETQKWLLQCAFERLPSNIFPVEISSISLHYSLNYKEYIEIYLQNLYKYSFYASSTNWVGFFKQQKFITKPIIILDTIPIKRNIILGRQKINYKEYQELCLGNIVLLNEINFDKEGNGCLNLGSFAIQLSYQNNNLVFQEWKTKMEDKKDYKDDWNLDEYTTQNDELNEENSEEYNYQNIEEQDNQEENIIQETENLEEAETIHPLANVPVNLTFSLGQMNLPIEQIMQLQQGTILNLQKNTPAQVEIHANSKLIGSGEIVEIDGQIGVQIINLDY